LKLPYPPIISILKGKNTESKILEFAEKGSAELPRLLRTARTGDATVPHMVFQISPADKKRLLSTCQFGAISRWALDILVRKYEAREADAAADFYRNIAPMRDAAPLQGHLFERQVLNHLSGISDKYDFPIRRLTDSEETMWTHPGKLTRFDFQDSTDSTFLKGITEAVQERKPMHLIPKARNFAADKVRRMVDREAGTWEKVIPGWEYVVDSVALSRFCARERSGGCHSLRPGRPGRSHYLYSNHEEQESRYCCLGSSAYSKVFQT
jgi:hypothetical protein